jgi:hypothetical protein
VKDRDYGAQQPPPKKKGKKKKKEQKAALKIRNSQSEEGFGISLRSL